MIYLDNAATSFPKPQGVLKAVLDNMENYGANPGRSGHKLAIEAGRVIYECRELACQLFNIDDPMRVVFTSNATEALNLGIKGVLNPGDHVITTSMEHNSVLRPIKGLEDKGVENTIVECSPRGNLDIRDLEKAIKGNTRLMVINHGSNVTGNIADIGRIGKIAKKHGVLFLLDGAQTAGVYDIDVKKMGIDLLAVAGHKGLMGPQGTGILYIGEGVELRQLMEGGTGSQSEDTIQPLMLPDRYESGTANTPGIAGLGAGIKFLLERQLEEIRGQGNKLTQYFLEGLGAISKLKIYGPQDIQRQGPVVSINIGEEDSSEIAYILDKYFNIGVRPGLHCAPLAHKTIGSLQQGTVRFSFGYFNKKEEIGLALEALNKISKDLI